MRGRRLGRARVALGVLGAAALLAAGWGSPWCALAALLGLAALGVGRRGGVADVAPRVAGVAAGARRARRRPAPGRAEEEGLVGRRRASGTGDARRRDAARQAALRAVDEDARALLGLLRDALGARACVLLWRHAQGLRPRLVVGAPTTTSLASRPAVAGPLAEVLAGGAGRGVAPGAARAGRGAAVALGLAAVVGARRAQGVVVVERDAPLDAQALGRVEATAGLLSRRLGDARRLLDMRVTCRRMASLAATDPLTGVANRRAFLGQLDAALAGDGGGPCALLLFDIDHFKAVNDAHGHPAGDAVIRGVARALVGSVRRADVVGRLGGEELGVVLRGAPPVAALEAAERARRAIAALTFGEAARPYRVTVSVGVALSGEGGGAGEAAALMARADEALYASKRGGRDRVTRWSVGLRTAAA